MPTPAANGVLVAVAARDLLGILIVIGLELGLVAAIGGASYVVVTWSTGRLETVRRRGSTPEATRARQLRLRTILVWIFTLLAMAILTYNGWLIVRRADVPGHTLALVGAMGRDLWAGLAMAVVKLGAATAGVLIGARVVRRVLGVGETTVNRWDQLRDNDRSLAVLLAGLRRAIVTVGWLLLAVYALQLFGLPAGFVAPS